VRIISESAQLYYLIMHWGPEILQRDVRLGFKARKRRSVAVTAPPAETGD
jgi:hypothetical protein